MNSNLLSQDSMQNVLIADDHAIIREHIIVLIREILPHVKIWEARDLASIINALKSSRMALAICDVHMPGCNGFQMLDTMRIIQPDMKIIIFTAYRSDIYARRFLQMGAAAFINKETEGEIVKENILSVWQGKKANESEEEVTGVVENNEENVLRILSNRELEILHLMVRGLNTLEICNELKLYNTTVSTYKKRIYKKLNVSSLPELIAIFKANTDGMVFD